jgi:hypothetical protein
MRQAHINYYNITPKEAPPLPNKIIIISLNNSDNT